MGDPYGVLGVSPTASDPEIRAAYRRLVKETHPDHNAGSVDAARRFEAVQEAYAEIQRVRAQSSPSRSQAAGSSPPPPRRRPAPPPPSASGPVDPEVEARIADLEQQVARAQAARAKAEQEARRAAREAMASAAGPDAAGRPDRPTDEELGYITTDDSLGQILADARAELSQRFENAGEHPVARRVRDLIDGLEELTDKLDRRPPRQ